MIRDRLIRIRVSVAERSRIEHAAACAGMNLSDWLRTAGTGRPADRRAMLQALSEVRRAVNDLGSNINQLVRAYHTGHNIDGPAVEAMYRDMQRIVAEAIRAEAS